MQEKIMEQSIKDYKKAQAIFKALKNTYTDDEIINIYKDDNISFKDYTFFDSEVLTVYIKLIDDNELVLNDYIVVWFDRNIGWFEIATIRDLEKEFYKMSIEKKLYEVLLGKAIGNKLVLIENYIDTNLDVDDLDVDIRELQQLKRQIAHSVDKDLETFKDALNELEQFFNQYKD